MRTLGAFGAPVTIWEGTYWLAVHNVDPTSDFCVGYTAAGSLTGTKAQTKTLTLGKILTTNYSYSQTCITPDGGHVMAGGSVISSTVYNTTTGVSTQVNAGGNGGIAASPDSAYFYSVSLNGLTLYRTRLSDNAVSTMSITGIQGGCGLFVTADSAYIHIAGGNGAVAVVRASDFSMYTNYNIRTPSNWTAGGCVMAPAGDYAYFGDGGNNAIRKVRLSDNTVVASHTGVGVMYDNSNNYVPMAIKQDGSLVFIAASSTGYVQGTTTSSMTSYGSWFTGVSQPITALAVDSSSNFYWTQPANNSYGVYTASASNFTTPFAANTNPSGICLNSNGVAFIACPLNTAQYIAVLNGITGVIATPTYMDATAATWTAQTYVPGVYLQGRPFGSASGW
jgi:hypothetical protein